MEKSGRIVLTPEDLAEFKNGRVSQRIRETWGLTLGELSEIIKAHQYTSTEEN
jgi:hypothetical protein